MFYLDKNASKRLLRKSIWHILANMPRVRLPMPSCNSTAYFCYRQCSLRTHIDKDLKMHANILPYSTRLLAHIHDVLIKTICKFEIVDALNLTQSDLETSWSFLLWETHFQFYANSCEHNSILSILTEWAVATFGPNMGSSESLNSGAGEDVEASFPDSARLQWPLWDKTLHWEHSSQPAEPD